MVEKFKVIFVALCPDFADAEFILRYQSGWTGDEDLLETLDNLYQRDLALGYTRSGPHAADWSIRINKADPQEILSRGQQKLFYLAIVFAQIQMLAKKENETSILLIDDLTSELDDRHQKTVLDLLQTLPVQSFITSTKQQLQTLIHERNNSVFHVEHGAVTNV